MAIKKTPKMNQESSQTRQLNGGISRGGKTLKSSRRLDKKWHTKNSGDTRRAAQTLSDKVWERDKFAAELEKRVRSSNASPSQKEHAQGLLRKINTAKSRERRDQITGRSGKLTKRQRNTNSLGVIRLKTF